MSYTNIPPASSAITASNNSISEIDEIPSETRYEVFRKKFHIPSDWKSNENFDRLLRIQYSKSSVEQAFNDIRTSFRLMGYLEDNRRMVHDYIHYMIKDLLAYKRIPFLDENDFSDPSNEIIRKYFQDCTPDLLIQGKKLIDIYVGYKDVASIKGKYRRFGDLFTFVVVTPETLSNLSELHILEAKDLDYLRNQFSIFQCEYQYWYSCIKLQKIIYNDRENLKTINLEEKMEETEMKSSESTSNRTAFVELQTKFKLTVIESLASLIRVRENENF
jgi:hypothetical protein